VSPALDACPGVLVLHPARDGLVARIRLPGGYAAAARWRALAALARDFGDGCVDVTARGNVQLRGLREARSAALAAAAAAVGLLPSAEHDRARNIAASPLAGLAGRPPLRALVDALDTALLAAPEFAALPGRFLFALDDGTGGATLATCDLGLRHAAPASADSVPAASVPTRPGAAEWVPGDFDLIVAGRYTGVRVPAGQAVLVVVAATRAALARGVGASVTRIADLPDGGESVAAAVGGTLGAALPPDVRLPLGPIPPAPPSPPSPPSPPTSSLSSAPNPARHTAPPSTPSSAPHAVPRGGVHDRDRFTAESSGISVTIMEDTPDADPGRPTGEVGEADGAGVLVVAARLGRLTVGQIQLITSLLAPGEVVRVGIAGRLVIPLAARTQPDAMAAGLSAEVGSAGYPAGHVAGPAGSRAGPSAGDAAGLSMAEAAPSAEAAAGRPEAAARLAAAGLIVAADDPMGDVTACSGAACSRSLADVRAVAGPVPDYRKTHWAGCSRRCGCPPDAEPVVALDAVRYRMPGPGAA
jgi:hypothetical protein